MAHILIVDDDEDDREIFCEAVRELEPNINCISARSAQDALSILRSEHYPRPDLIFIDLYMPRIDGWQFLHEIKKDRFLRDIPAVIYTTSKLNDDQAEANAIGAVHYLVKPYGFFELCEELRQILQKQMILEK
jgi:CheY-like chemotaxis protein